MHNSMSLRTLAIASALAMTAACSAIERGDVTLRPRIGGSDHVPPRDPTAIPPARSDTGSVGTMVPENATQVRRVCRAQGWSRDWIATAYENASGDCPKSGESDSTALAAIIVRLDAQPRGVLLDICGDQAIPTGWVLVAIEGEPPPQRCPGAARGGASAMERIRRVR